MNSDAEGIPVVYSREDVNVLADSYEEAMFVAAGMVMRAGIEMPTSTRLVL